mgnify:CR=1 FL=1
MDSFFMVRSLNQVHCVSNVEKLCLNIVENKSSITNQLHMRFTLTIYLDNKEISIKRFSIVLIIDMDTKYVFCF